MNITTFGTCRIDNLDNSTNLQNDITYTHTTKEVLLLIDYISGKIHLDYPYTQFCFRTGIINNKQIEYTDMFNKKLSNSKTVLIEICSRKKYMYNDIPLHHLCVDNRFNCWNTNTPISIINNHRVEIQSDEEIENDIIEIKKRLCDCKLIIISHYDSFFNNSHIKSRHELICLLENICKKHLIDFINPTEILSKYKQEEVMSSDLGHYTDFGKAKVNEYLNNYISKY